MRTAQFVDSKSPCRAALRAAAVPMRVLASLGVLVMGSSVGAAESPDLFRAEVPVARKDSAAQTEAFRHGLEEVLGRVLRPQDLGSAPVRALLSKPDSAVLEFVYPGTVKSGQPILQIDFDEDQLRKLLRTKSIGLFGPNRPEVVAWIAVEDEESADTLPVWDRTLRELAARRALLAGRVAKKPDGYEAVWRLNQGARLRPEPAEPRTAALSYRLAR